MLNYKELFKRSSSFWNEVTSIPEVKWYTKHEITYEDSAIRLLSFRKTTNRKPAILIVPPQAGHSSTIADFDNKKSLVQTALMNTDRAVYCIDWKSCTFARRNERVEDLVEQVLNAITAIGKEVIIVGLCQGGWLSAIVAYMCPDKVKKLILAAAPIDAFADCENSIICKAIPYYPQSFYESLVALGGGLLLGQFMLAGWKMNNFVDRYYLDYFDLWEASKDADKMRNIHKFRGWYEHTQNIAGAWYLDIVERIFRNNDLWEDRFRVNGILIKLRELKQEVISLAGRNDDITPVAQALALKGTHHIVEDVGHIGVFMSSKSQRVWAEVFSNL